MLTPDGFLSDIQCDGESAVGEMTPPPAVPLRRYSSRVAASLVPTYFGFTPTHVNAMKQSSVGR